MKHVGISTIFGRRSMPVITAVLIEIAVAVCCLLLFATGMTVWEGGTAFAPLFATLSVSAGAFAAAFYQAKKARKKGWLYGLLTGGITFAFLTVIGLAFGDGNVTLTSLFRLIILLLASLIGGILGVGKAENHQYL